ncbi:hypothetical protein COOONC_13505 [Cooperia oncophora]
MDAESDGDFTGEDSDVIAEKSNVKTMDVQNTAVVVDDIKKRVKASKERRYTSRYGDFEAVKGVTFHVKTGQCFGLLGVNGAGKTSTFQMLTGENEITEGDAFVNGWSVKSNWKKAGANIGYCPQFDAVLKEMTGEETLYMFARIRGIPKKEIPEKVKAVIHTIGIGLYAKRQIKGYRYVLPTLRANRSSTTNFKNHVADVGKRKKSLEKKLNCHVTMGWGS